MKKLNPNSMARYAKSQALPWQDAQGNPLSEKALAFLSASWDQETWEGYLESLEKKQQELLVACTTFANTYRDPSKTAMEQLTEEKEYYARTGVRTPALPNVDDALKILSDRQRQVFKATYIDKLRTRDIVKALGICRQRVHQLRVQAIHNLRRHYGAW